MGMNQVFVTNTNEFAHTDQYDGDAYTFPPGEKVLIPYDAAVHMFGRGLDDKTETLVRLGWAQTFDPASRQFVENPDGVKRLAAFVFEEAILAPKSSLERALEKPAA
jgi:hypothetical protein